MDDIFFKKNKGVGVGDPKKIRCGRWWGHYIPIEINLIDISEEGESLIDLTLDR